ncbi:MAG TPA: hypothetical protein VMU50_00380 [Polyangia bacterium]|nr:hypothetical protein [Polyangia bacterium]
MKLFVAGLVAWMAFTAAGCATAPAVGRGGPVYDISIATIDGYPTADRGPAAYPAVTIQVGTSVARVWLAHPSHLAVVSPVIMEGDATALKDGILVERSWNEAVVYRVTDQDLDAGAALVYVPSMIHPPTVVELRFDPVARVGPAAPSSLQREDNLSEGRPTLEEPVSDRHVR